MEDVMKGSYKVPSFGSWNNFYDQKSMKEADLFAAHFFVGGGDELFKVLSPYTHHPQIRMEKKRGAETEGKKLRKPRAIDEDLYQIPPELLCQMPKKKKLLRNFWAGCLCLNCIA